MDVFLLALIEIIPPTSFVVPLLGQYLLFTLTLVTVSVLATVYVLNINYRSASSHKMSRFQRWLYLDILPRLLRMKGRHEENCDEVSRTKLVHCKGTESTKHHHHNRLQSSNQRLKHKHHHQYLDSNTKCNNDECCCDESPLLLASQDYEEKVISLCRLGHNEVKNAFLSLDFVSKRMENRENYNKIEDDWHFAATVIDRLLLYLFSAVCVIGTCIIILQAPALYDNSEPIDVKLSKLGPKIRPNLPDSFDDGRD